MILSPSRQFIFLHIHKTGGESVTAALVPYLAPIDLVMHHNYERLSREERRRFSQYRTLEKHSNAIAIKAAVGDAAWPSYYRFSFVRNPIDRAISYYNYCGRQTATRTRVRPGHTLYHTPRGRRKDPLRWPAIRAFRRTQSFSEFIRDPIALADPGMQTQYSFVRDASGAIELDFIGHFESFAEDFAMVQSRLGIPPSPPPHTNVTPRQLVTRASIDPDDVAYLRELYAVDLERFEYES